MKIGIITFHWATNYGAILQAYALQEYLIGCGYDVEIINYKPKSYDFNWMIFLRHSKALLTFGKRMKVRKKEKLLSLFREKNLKLTKRYYTQNEIEQASFDYDLIISGSDQILNPSFTISGEGKPTSSYYLSFAKNAKQKMGYAVSFGCVDYPEPAKQYAKQWINNFDKIGVRESTGLKILESLEFKNKGIIVPDPTILMGKELFEKVTVEPPKDVNDYICVYMLRRRIKVKNENVVYIDDNHKPLSLEQWLGCIKNTKAFITNSYHGLIMAILFHIPFVVVLEQKKGVGMNDRFVTLLQKFNLLERISVGDINRYQEIMRKPIHWEEVDVLLKQYSDVGKAFLKF